MPPKYAENTTVSVGDSQAEIERVLTKYGADQFLRGWEEGRAFLAFRINGRHIRMHLNMPSKSSFRYTEARGMLRSEAVQQAEWDKECKRLWRVLLILVKGKLESVAAGVVDFNKEFQPYTLLPNNQTAGDWLEPQIEDAYKTGTMPSLMPMLPSPSKGGSPKNGDGK